MSWSIRKKDCVLSGITLSDRDGQGDGRADAKRKSRRKPEEKKLKGSRKSRSWKQQQTERAADRKSSRHVGGYRQMLNYEEEIRKFKPSLEVEDIEDAVYEEDLTDMQDLLKEVMEKKKKKK